jgi:hypothetical protein
VVQGDVIFLCQGEEGHENIGNRLWKIGYSLLLSFQNFNTKKLSEFFLHIEGLKRKKLCTFALSHNLLNF